MLKNLIRFSIHNSGMVLVLASIMVAFALYRLPHASVDVFPELNAPTVVVMGEAPGLATDEVEQYVTYPMESAVNGIPGVRRVRSTSSMGLAITYVEFDWGMDIYRARQLVSERLDSVREELPEGTHAEMTPITSITGEIMLLTLSSPGGTRSAMDLRAMAEFDIRKKLVAIPGVAQASVIGGELPEYQVLVGQEELRAFGLTFADVEEAARASHSTLSAGYLADVDNMEIPIRQSGRVRSIADIEGTLVKYTNGAPVTIGQVATVQMGSTPQRGLGSDGGHPAVIITVQKAPGTNTLAITQQVDALLDQLDPTLPAGCRINREVFRQSDFIERSVGNVVKALRDAALIVTIILALFLLNARTTLVTLTALPLSLAAGLLALDWMGESINVMTLGGLAIAVGSLVDDAIIDVENVFRRLKQNAGLPPAEQRSRLDVIFDASNEIRPAMVFATAIIVLVFLPLMFLDGIEGRFFRPLGIAFVMSLLASLLVALTVTPALCKLLLRVPSGEGAERDGWLVRWLKALYEPTLRVALRFKLSLLGLAGVATGLTLWLGSTFGTAFLPEFSEGTFSIGLFSPPGTSLQASDRMASAIEKQFMQIEGVSSVARRTGRAERDEHAEPVSTSEIDVTLQPGYHKEDVREQISRILNQVPGITSNIGQPIEHRLSHILSGTPAAIAINVYGEDLNVLRKVAQEIQVTLEGLPGTRDVKANREVMVQTLPIEYRARSLAAYGLTPVSAAEQVRAAMFGETVAVVGDGNKRYGLAVRLREQDRDSVDDLRHLILYGENGTHVRLDEVADLGPELASYSISRENSQRKAVVSLNVAEGANLGHLVEKVKERVDPIVQAAGYQVHYGGQFEAQQSATQRMLLLGGMVLLAMFMLLHVAIGSLRVSALVLVNLPLALIGGIAAIFVSDSSSLVANLSGLFGQGPYVAPVLSIASLVGFITLFGIAVRNGILLVNHYGYLQEHEGYGLREAILRGSQERLVPILMTALTAALALVPIVIEADQPGNEILAPLSVVILGGLLTSTFLNLLIVPAGYALLCKERPVESSDPSQTPNPA
ncbi:MAG: efflux RND transporter permease subunit [Planctomycetota bacterium]|nr:efflux RND transporter permease subunit [Planctomycetota bacterium]